MAATGFYHDKSDVQNNWGAVNVALWSNLDNESTGENEARIQEGIDASEAEVNDWLRKMYTIPLTATAANGLRRVTHWCAELTGVWLYQSRGLDEDDDFGEVVNRRAETVRREISAYASSERILAAARPETRGVDVPVVVP